MAPPPPPRGRGGGDMMMSSQTISLHFHTLFIVIKNIFDISVMKTIDKCLKLFVYVCISNTNYDYQFLNCEYS